MKLSDIDFGRLGQMMDSLSPEQKGSLDAMAQRMMENMSPADDAEEAVDFMEALGLDERYELLDGNTLGALEAAWDMEDFYDADEDADYSAAVLFYGKAVLYELRRELFPLLKAVTGFSGHSLKDVLAALDDETVERMTKEGIGSKEQWESLRAFLVQLLTQLYIAESDKVTCEMLQGVKRLVLDDGHLLEIKEFD